MLPCRRVNLSIQGRVRGQGRHESGAGAKVAQSRASCSFRTWILRAENRHLGFQSALLRQTELLGEGADLVLERARGPRARRRRLGCSSTAPRSARGPETRTEPRWSSGSASVVLLSPSRSNSSSGRAATGPRSITGDSGRRDPHGGATRAIEEIAGDGIEGIAKVADEVAVALGCPRRRGAGRGGVAVSLLPMRLTPPRVRLVPTKKRSGPGAGEPPLEPGELAATMELAISRFPPESEIPAPLPPGHPTNRVAT